MKCILWKSSKLVSFCTRKLKFITEVFSFYAHFLIYFVTRRNICMSIILMPPWFFHFNSVFIESITYDVFLLYIERTTGVREVVDTSRFFGYILHNNFFNTSISPKSRHIIGISVKNWYRLIWARRLQSSNIFLP